MIGKSWFDENMADEIIRYANRRARIGMPAIDYYPRGDGRAIIRKKGEDIYTELTNISYLGGSELN